MATGRKAFALGCAAIALGGLFSACEGSSGNPGPVVGEAGADTAGTSSGAASSGGGSAAGQPPDGPGGAGSSESAGGADTDGNAGEPGRAGSPNASGGAGEPGGGGAECMVDQDCAVFNDCCECDVGAADEKHPTCEKLCIQSACDARGIQAQARCWSNRCIFDLSCDHSAVTCKAAKPECPSGQVPSVVEACWGPCIEVSHCREVTDCTTCPAGTVCVENQDSAGGFTQCVEVEASCAQKPTCACVDACLRSCSEEDGITCFCPFC